jgi:8-oxo-dGTP pyrophosphatase MutT (NUDIX family)
MTISIYPGLESGMNPFVFAAVLEWRGRIALFRGSPRQGAGRDGGLWRCVSGSVEPTTSLEQQLLEGLFEETGLQATDLLDLRRGRDVVVADGAGDPRFVHTFTALTSCRRLKISGEHDSYRWTAPPKARRFVNRATWLDTVLDATGHCPATIPTCQS